MGMLALASCQNTDSPVKPSASDQYSGAEKAAASSAIKLEIKSPDQK